MNFYVPFLLRPRSVPSPNCCNFWKKVQGKIFTTMLAGPFGLTPQKAGFWMVSYNPISMTIMALEITLVMQLCFCFCFFRITNQCRNRMSFFAHDKNRFIGSVRNKQSFTTTLDMSGYPSFEWANINLQIVLKANVSLQHFMQNLYYQCYVSAFYSVFWLFVFLCITGWQVTLNDTVRISCEHSCTSWCVN